MPAGGANGYSWTPSFSPTLTPSNRLYFAGDGGTVEYTDSPDAAGPNSPAIGRLAFFGLSNYNANPAAYNSTVFINTPITSDAAGDIFFGFLVTGSNPLGLTSGVARIGADGTGSFAAVVAGTTQVATNSAPALSNDGNVLYVLESSGNFGSGKLVALDSHTLAVQAQVTLMDPHNTSQTAVITNDATASPTVGPDGDVYIGVLENPFASNHDRGWLLHFSGQSRHGEDSRRIRLGRYSLHRPGLDGAVLPWVVQLPADDEVQQLRGRRRGRGQQARDPRPECHDDRPGHGHAA